MFNFILLSLFLINYSYSQEYEDHDISTDSFKNQLRFQYGVNYKYRGMVHHSLDRVWIVTKIPLPKFSDVKFESLQWDPSCSWLYNSPTYQTPRTHLGFQVLCNSTKLRTDMINARQEQYKKIIREMLVNDLYSALPDLDIRSRKRLGRVKRSENSPSSHMNSTSCEGCNLRMATNFTKIGTKVTILEPFNRKRRLAFIPFLGSIAKVFIKAIPNIIPVVKEVVNFFKGKKRNSSMKQALIKMSDQKELNVLNKLKQLGKDFLLYGKYSLGTVQGILGTIRQMVDKTTKWENLMTGQDLNHVKDLHTSQTGFTLYSKLHGPTSRETQ
jgi:hypothetical protein